MDTLRLQTRANTSRLIEVASGCDGSPLCAVEVHIETREPFGWQAHLTPDEAVAVRDAIDGALREYHAERAAPWPPRRRRRWFRRRGAS